VTQRPTSGRQIGGGRNGEGNAQRGETPDQGETRREGVGREAGGRRRGLNDPEGRRGITRGGEVSQDARRVFFDPHCSFYRVQPTRSGRTEIRGVSIHQQSAIWQFPSGPYPARQTAEATATRVRPQMSCKVLVLDCDSSLSSRGGQNNGIPVCHRPTPAVCATGSGGRTSVLPASLSLGVWIQCGNLCGAGSGESL
jgi:hypothetical protein